jgi:hypothetical protein
MGLDDPTVAAIAELSGVSSCKWLRFHSAAVTFSARKQSRVSSIPAHPSRSTVAVLIRNMLSTTNTVASARAPVVTPCKKGLCWPNGSHVNGGASFPAQGGVLDPRVETELEKFRLFLILLSSC